MVFLSWKCDLACEDQFGTEGIFRKLLSCDGFRFCVHRNSSAELLLMRNRWVNISMWFPVGRPRGQVLSLCETKRSLATFSRPPTCERQHTHPRFRHSGRLLEDCRDLYVCFDVFWLIRSAKLQRRVANSSGNTLDHHQSVGRQGEEHRQGDGACCSIA